MFGWELAVSTYVYLRLWSYRVVTARTLLNRGFEGITHWTPGWRGADAAVG